MSFQFIRKDNCSPIKAWIRKKGNGDFDIEQDALQQLYNISSMPFIFKHVAVMPDVHLGKGATIGSVIATKNAIIPATVGVDIGCGMSAVKTSLTASELPDSLSELRNRIEKIIPHGRTDNGGINDIGAWNRDKIPSTIQEYWNDNLKLGYQQLTFKYPKLTHHNTIGHLGTLGTGNHFIEICLDQDNNVWIMLHSGSRGPGNKIGQFFIELAKQDMKKWFINVPDQDLSYFPKDTDHFNDYWYAVQWCQDYALLNRQLMMTNVLIALRQTKGIPFTFNANLMAIDCHHNYVSIENHFGENVFITRKGAVRAREKDLGIIPGSMGAKSFIVKGKGNAESFMSCSHGAGRKMSRNKAKQKYTIEDLIRQTKGVECRKDVDVIDEIPLAYKNIDDVIKLQDDLVEPLYTLKQILCIKG